MTSERAGQSVPFVSVTDMQQLEELLKLSQEKPVVIFKHSTTCPISAAAYQQMEQMQHEVSLVVVQRSRELSREVEERTGIRHESPQAIILRNGKAAWHASHWKITAEAVERAVRENE
ncbi:MAG TPA: bacillithiol system redox-active protein YtxJ [Pyrinomonadaceae bacterium]|jgi:bacillithiol system protein YtxJ